MTGYELIELRLQNYVSDVNNRLLKENALCR